MRNINSETGCIYDTLVFLSLYADEVNGIDVSSNKYYQAIMSGLLDKGYQIHEYIYPFVYKKNESGSFLQSLVFNGESYRKCTYDRLVQIINNKAFFKRAYVDFCFPTLTDKEKQELLSCDNPNIISIVRASSPDKDLEAYILNSFFYFEIVARFLSDTIKNIYKVLEQFRVSVFIEIGITKLFHDDTILNMFYAITNLDNNSSLIFSLSILSAELISFNLSEPNYILLGYDFTKKLDEEYKYCNATLLSLSKAVGNIVKYDIFSALAKKKQPLNMADMFTALSYGRRELDYNLKEMQKSGLIEVDHIEGRQKYYKLDVEFLQVIIEQLSFVIQ